MADEAKPVKIAVVTYETLPGICPGSGAFAAFNGRRASFTDYAENLIEEVSGMLVLTSSRARG